MNAISRTIVPETEATSVMEAAATPTPPERAPEAYSSWTEVAAAFEAAVADAEAKEHLHDDAHFAALGRRPTADETAIADASIEGLIQAQNLVRDYVPRSADEYVRKAKMLLTHRAWETVDVTGILKANAAQMELSASPVAWRGPVDDKAVNSVIAKHAVALQAVDFEQANVPDDLQRALNDATYTLIRTPCFNPSAIGYKLCVAFEGMEPDHAYLNSTTTAAIIADEAAGRDAKLIASAARDLFTLSAMLDQHSEVTPAPKAELAEKLLQAKLLIAGAEAQGYSDDGDTWLGEADFDAGELLLEQIHSAEPTSPEDLLLKLEAILAEDSMWRRDTVSEAVHDSVEQIANYLKIDAPTKVSGDKNIGFDVATADWFETWEKAEAAREEADRLFAKGSEDADAAVDRAAEADRAVYYASASSYFASYLKLYRRIEADTELGEGFEDYLIRLLREGDWTEQFLACHFLDLHGLVGRNGVENPISGLTSYALAAVSYPRAEKARRERADRRFSSHNETQKAA